MHLGLTGTAWALGSCRISQHLSTLRALGSVFLPLLYFLVSLLYFCCSFLSGSFVIFLFFFFFLPCLAMSLAYILPPQKKKKSSLWHQAASHCRPRRWCKGTGLLPGKVPAQPGPAPSSLGSPVPPSLSPRPPRCPARRPCRRPAVTQVCHLYVAGLS